MKATARKILAAAIPCFAAKGKRGTTTRDVAQAAGVNIATLAYHFGGKDGLYQASVRSLYEPFLVFDPAQLELEGSPRERLETLVRLIYQLMREHRTEVRLLLRHVMEEGQLPSATRDEGWTDLLLERAEAVLRKFGIEPAPGWRMHLLSLNFLLARYAVSPPEDLAPFFPGAEDPQPLIEAHLAQLASTLLIVS